jgi:hypothetical protein
MKKQLVEFFELEFVFFELCPKIRFATTSENDRDPLFPITSSHMPSRETCFPECMGAINMPMIVLGNGQGSPSLREFVVPRLPFLKTMQASRWFTFQLLQNLQIH